MTGDGAGRTRIVFFGGNGHSAARLAGARALAEAHGLAVWSVPYPGFEGRGRAAGFEAFLDDVGAAVREGAAAGERDVVYATGVGGLLVLALRARGALRETPVILQAPVLWGLERRWMPRVMRLGLAQVALRRAFASPMFQRRFARKHFRVAPSAEALAGFFEGYATCAALPDFFEWLTPALLRSLEARHREDPGLLRGVRFLWGAEDTVVPPRELAWSEEALGVKLPVEIVPAWGHYPMIDDPEGWVREVSRVASAATL